MLIPEKYCMRKTSPLSTSVFEKITMMVPQRAMKIHKCVGVHIFWISLSTLGVRKWHELWIKCNPCWSFRGQFFRTISFWMKINSVISRGWIIHFYPSSNLRATQSDPYLFLMTQTDHFWTRIAESKDEKSAI